MDISFVLIEAAHPENIGAAARAIKTMGFRELILVNPADHLSEEAKRLAHASTDILEKAVVLQSFDEVRQNHDFVIGTSAKKRNIRNDYYLSDGLAGFLEERSEIIHKPALVFGREQSGLSNEEILQCDLITTIPIRAKYPSINLAQSVMIYAYLLSRFNFSYRKAGCHKNENILFTLKEQLNELINILGLDNKPAFSNRLRERVMAANADDIHLILSVCNKLIDKLKD